MSKDCPFSNEAKEGMALLIWESHGLSQSFSSFDKEDRAKEVEESRDVLNWTAKVYINRFHSPVYDLSLSKDQVIGMSTFVPDKLISLILTCRRYTTFIGAVLFADVSGFTPLCETYAKFGPNGAYRLTATLNQYIGAMVDLIYTFGGDVIKFSGDAFLAVWHVRVNDFLYHKIHDAIFCALHIQYTLGNFVTDVGLHLRVKLAISAGNLVFSAIGKEKSATYVLYGLPILEVKKAESLCKSGDTVVAPSAWASLSPHNYGYQELGGGYMKIKQILYDPRSVKRKIFEFDPNFIMQIHKRNRMLKLTSSKTDPSATILDFKKNFRKVIFEDSLVKGSESLRPFVLPPVMQQIEANQSLDYTVEMRQVTIMFINVIPLTTSCREIVILADETYRSILKSIQGRLGLINKVCLFDKDMMFLVIFGLKGYKDKDEASRALRSGYEIVQTVSDFTAVKSISIGVTVGTTYCGVVGHPLRKEYTVIGAPVNKAARLGCMFKGMVSCDATVAFNSRLPPTFFEKMEPKTLKGIGTVTNIYRYMEIGVSALTAPPILGRYNTIKKFNDMLWDESPYKTMVITGEPRVGKTRVLLEICDAAEQADWVPILSTLNTKIGPHICVIQKMIANILGSTPKERMYELRQIHSDENDIENLHILNDYFDVNFPVPPYEGYERRNSRESYDLYRKTLKKMFDKHVILVDDADGLDNESWPVLLELIKVPNVLVALTLPCSSENLELHVTQYLTNPLVTVVKLGNLPYKYIAPLVCQMLAVDAVPHKLIRALFKISRGNPGWVQAFLLSYVDRGAFIVTSEFVSKISRKSFFVPDQITRMTKSSISFSLTDDLPFSEEKIHVCKLTKTDLGENGIPPTFDDVIMATFDNLTAFEQLLLKCGAILGKEFQRTELEAVMNFPSNLTLALAVKNLFEIDVLGCGSKSDTQEKHQNSYIPFGFKEPIKCLCPEGKLGRLIRLPKYGLCQYMTFRFELLRKTIYQIIPINQMTEFHLRAFSHLRKQNAKCTECVNYEILLNIRKKNQMVAGMGRMSYRSDGSIDRRRRITSKTSVRGGPVDVRRRAVLGVSRATQQPKFEEPTDSYSSPPDLPEDPRVSLILELPLYIPHVMKCTCKHILMDMYEKLLYHSNAADAKVEKLNILVEYGIHNVKYSNFPKAYELLKAALELSEELIRNLSVIESSDERRGFDAKKKKKQNISVKEIVFAKEKALCYFGKCCTHLGNYRRAYIELSKVANVSVITNIQFLFKKILMRTKIVPEKYKEKMREYIGLKSFCYTFLSHAHLLQLEYPESEEAIKTALRYANMANQLECLASAYATYIDINLLRGHFKQSMKAEKEAMQKCMLLFDEKNIWHVMYIGRVFTAVFKGRLYRGELSEAIDIAKAILKSIFTFRVYNVLSFVYPLFLQCLAFQKNLDEIVDVLYNLKTCYRDYSTFEKYIFDRLYNHLNCILLTEIGFSMEVPGHLIPAMQKKYKTHIKPKYRSDAVLSRRLLIQMWLWHIRREEFSLAEEWEVEPHDGIDLLYEFIPSSLTLLQAQLQWFVYCINLNNEINTEVANKLDQRIKKLEWTCKKRRLFLLPRLLHMKAYKNVICFNYEDSKRQIPGMFELKKALKYARDHGNIHEIAWIHQSINEWYGDKEVHREERQSDSYICMMAYEGEKVLYQYQNEETLYHLPLPDIIVTKLKECIKLNEDVLLATGLLSHEDTYY